jgi:hypothetical protein
MSKLFVADRDKTMFWKVAKGFTDLNASLNPKTTDKTYIDDTTETITNSFQVKWEVSGDFYMKDPASEFLYKQSKKLVMGDDAIIWVIRVDTWETVEDCEGWYHGYLHECTWVPSNDGGGAGGESVTFSGTINGKGDRTEGYVQISPATDLVKAETATFTTVKPEPDE